MASLTHTSMGPSSRSTLCAAASTCSGSATSVRMARASPPAASISSLAPSKPSSPLASRATFAPCLPNSRAVARPTPAEAPVITTTSALLVSMRFLNSFSRSIGLAGRLWSAGARQARPTSQLLAHPGFVGDPFGLVLDDALHRRLARAHAYHRQHGLASHVFDRQGQSSVERDPEQDEADDPGRVLQAGIRAQLVEAGEEEARGRRQQNDGRHELAEGRAQGRDEERRTRENQKHPENDAGRRGRRVQFDQANGEPGRGEYAHPRCGGGVPGEKAEDRSEELQGSAEGHQGERHVQRFPRREPAELGPAEDEGGSAQGEEAQSERGGNGPYEDPALVPFGFGTVESRRSFVGDVPLVSHLLPSFARVARSPTRPLTHLSRPQNAGTRPHASRCQSSGNPGSTKQARAMAGADEPPLPAHLGLVIFPSFSPARVSGVPAPVSLR